MTAAEGLAREGTGEEPGRVRRGADGGVPASPREEPAGEHVQRISQQQGSVAEHQRRLRALDDRRRDRQLRDHGEGLGIEQDEESGEPVLDGEAVVVHQATADRPTAPELELAEVLIRELTGIEQRALHDEYGHALEQLIAAKASGGELAESPVEPVPAVDLMAELEASVRAARAKRGEFWSAQRGGRRLPLPRQPPLAEDLLTRSLCTRELRDHQRIFFKYAFLHLLPGQGWKGTARSPRKDRSVPFLRHAHDCRDSLRL